MAIRWQDWINVLLGCWLVASPSQMGYLLNHVATGNACGIGVLLVLFNVIAVCRIIDSGQEIVNILVGVWLILSPYALGFAAERNPALNAMFVGVAVIIFSCWQVLDTVIGRRK